jgi:RHS repeat-associated protein
MQPPAAPKVDLPELPAHCLRTLTEIVGGDNPGAEGGDGNNPAGPGANSPPESEGDPIIIPTGENRVDETDLVIPCPHIDLVFHRAYVSSDEDNVGLGHGWHHPYDWMVSGFFRESNPVLDDSHYEVLADGSISQTPEFTDCIDLNYLVLEAVANPHAPGLHGAYYWFTEDSEGNYYSRSSFLIQIESGISVTAPGGIEYLFDTDGDLYFIEHPSGASVTITHGPGTFDNPNGYPRKRIELVEHSNGMYLDFDYSGDFIQAVRTPDPNIYVTFTYDAEGDLRSATRHTARGNFTTTYGYRWRTEEELYPEDPYATDDPVYSLHWLDARTNANGNIARYTYEDDVPNSARVTASAIDGDLYETSVDYDTAASTLVTQDRAGTDLTTRYIHDPITKLIGQIIGPPHDGGRKEIRTYDLAQDLQSKRYEEPIDAQSLNYVEYDYTYEDRHLVESAAVGYNAEPGDAVTIAWNTDLALPTAVSDAMDVTVEIDYNDLALPEEIRLPDGASTHTTTIGYDASGNLAAITNANGHVTEFTHTTAGYFESVVPPVGPWYKVPTRSANGFPTIIYRYQGISSNWRVGILPDEQGRPLRIIRQGPGLYTREYFTYDAYGNVLSYQDPAGRTTAFTYNLGRMTSASRTLSDQTEVRIDIGYDNQFNTLSITDALDRAVEACKLDSADRVIAVTNLEEQVMTVDYTVAGFLDQIERFDGTVLKVGYSNRGLLNSLQYDYDEQTQSAALTSSYTYRNNGQLHYAINEAGTVECTYDAAGRPFTDDGAAPGPVDAVVEYDFDPVGSLVYLAHLGGEYDATYDDAERLDTLDGPEGLFEYSYNQANGLVAEIEYPNGVTAFYSYDGFDRITGIEYEDDTQTTLRSRTYTHNLLNLITNVVDETGDSIRYTYDELDRLNVAQYVVGGQLDDKFEYYYDLAGNRTLTKFNGASTTWMIDDDNGDSNRLESWGSGTDILYDDAGNVEWMEFADSRELDLTWNARYQLTAVKVDDVPTESYTYDALGRRVSTTAGATTTYYVYSGMDVVAETDAAGNLLRSYVHGPGVDDILAMTIHSGPSAGTYFYLKDHLGSVMALTDEDGDIVESYAYDPYANITARNAQGQPLSASAYGNRYTFQGREYAWSTGLYYFRARWYEPVTGRWLSKDPIGIGGGLNQYVAFRNNAILLCDPDGLQASHDPTTPIPIDDSDLLEVLQDYWDNRLHAESRKWNRTGAYNADTMRWGRHPYEGMDARFLYKGKIYERAEVNYIAEGAYVRHTKGPFNIPSSGWFSVLYHNLKENDKWPSKGKWFFYKRGKELYDDIKKCPE